MLHRGTNIILIVFFCVVFATVSVPVGVGMESGIITDNQLTSSSNQGPEYGAKYSRLNSRLGAGAWCAGSCDSSEFLQIDLGQVYLIYEVNCDVKLINCILKWKCTLRWCSFLS